MTVTNSGYIDRARLRVRSVRFKDGRGELRLLKPPRREFHDDLIGELRDLCSEFSEDPDFAGKLAGFAITAWFVDERIRHTRFRIAPDNPIMLKDIPDYVRDATQIQVSRMQLRLNTDD